jgi:hypothetical protein
VTFGAREDERTAEESEHQRVMPHNWRSYHSIRVAVIFAALATYGIARFVERDVPNLFPFHLSAPGVGVRSVVVRGRLELACCDSLPSSKVCILRSNTSK